VSPQKPRTLVISTGKAARSCENRFSNPLCNYRLQSRTPLIRENTERTEGKNKPGGQSLGQEQRRRRGEELGYGKAHAAQGKQ